MTAARIRLCVAAAAFLGWMVWLSSAVFDKGRVTPVSRAQLTEANVLVVAEVSGADGKPVSRLRVAKRIGDNGPAEGAEIDVANLPQAGVPGRVFPGPGTYLLPLVTRDNATYSIAGLPRSPGYEAVTNPAQPSIYPWTESLETQLRSLGYSW